MITFNKLIFAFFLIPFLFTGLNILASPRYTPVSGFEINRYMGKWYEIARLPVWFEKGLVNVTATYILGEDGNVRVVNEGFQNTKYGKHKSVNGKAKIGKSPDLGYFRVTFFWPFYGDYIIVELDPDYKYALVASSPKNLWILSREPKIDRAVLESLLEKAGKLGFDINKLYLTPQEW